MKDYGDLQIDFLSTQRRAEDSGEHRSLACRIRRLAECIFARSATCGASVTFCTANPAVRREPHRTTGGPPVLPEVVVAALQGLVRGKIWAWQDQERRLTKRRKDELDLIRIAEAYPHLAAIMPAEIVRQLELEDEE